MMKRILAWCFTAGFAFRLAAGVTASFQGGGDGRSAVLENEHLRAVFSNPGGRLSSLTEKDGNTDLVYDTGESATGACKDQFPPIDFSFRDSDYSMELLENTPEKAVLRLVSQNGTLQWKFQKIIREYTLRKGEARLECRIRIENQKENMAPVDLEYWMHGFLGVRGMENRFFHVSPDGVKGVVPSDESNKTVEIAPARGWIGMIGRNGKGVILVPEYRRLASVYAWYCKGSMPLDTLEFRLIKERIPEGGVLETEVVLGIAGSLPFVSGAGADGEGFLSVRDGKAEVELRGFVDRPVTVVLRSGGGILARAETRLESGKPTRCVLGDGSVPADASAEVLSPEGVLLFDLLPENAKISPLEKRNDPVLAKEKWQFDFSDGAEIPYYGWSAGGAERSVLMLVPLNGMRDVVELRKRMNLKTAVPVLYPNDFEMSWNIACTVPAGPDRTGCARAGEFFKDRSYDAIVIGGTVGAPWDRKQLSWKDYPESVRTEILNRVRNGAGLLYVNPNDADGDLAEALAKAEDFKPELAKTLPLEEAPYFDRTEIRSGFLGKGRVVTVRYPLQGFLTPHPGGRIIAFRSLTEDSRFWEYQFAILVRLVNEVCGNPNGIREMAFRGGNLEIDLEKPSTVRFDVFDKYTDSFGTFEKTLPAGKSSVMPPPLRAGKNFIHAVLPSGGFACAVAEKTDGAHIRSVRIDTKSGGVHAKVSVSGGSADARVETEIADADGRIVVRGAGEKLDWDDLSRTVSSLHTLTAVLYDGGRVADRKKRTFHLPEKWDASNHFANLVWTAGDCYPEYVYPWRWRVLREMGFNFIYTGSTAERSFSDLMRFSVLECGSNWLGPGMFHSNKNIPEWEKTHDPKYLVRGVCPNNPGEWNPADGGKDAEIFREFGTRRIFQLGDEMSITYYNTPWDACFCEFCLRDFRKWLEEKYGSLETLNAKWKTSFRSWDGVRPMTRTEIMSHASPGPWVDHRLYMDHVFVRTLLGCRENIRKIYPGALVGPTGVLNVPHVYGGNWNFRNMGALDCVSTYGTARIPASFDREKRLVMNYAGYGYPEAETMFNIWENIVTGGRSTNNWYGPVFVLPNLEAAPARKFYSDLMWDLRTGTVDLLYGSKKDTGTAAILHSQNSLMANYLKQRKTDYWKKELSFARMLEDSGVPYRFVAPDEIVSGALKGFRTLFLPEASALSDAEIGAILEFVRNGGSVVADYEAGTLDEVCSRRKENPLDALFGIDGTRFKLVSPENPVWGGKVGSGVKTAGGGASASARVKGREVPLLIANTFGKGRALMLNFSHDYSEWRGTEEGRAFLKLFDSVLPAERPAKVESDCAVMHGFYRNGENLYVALLPEPPGGNWKELTKAGLEARKFQAEIRFEKEGFLYDSRGGRFLGRGRVFQVELTPSDASIFAMLPYEVKLSGVLPEHAAPGESVRMKASVPGGGHHVFRMRVFAPDGKEMLCLRKIAETENGSVEFVLPFAYNDPEGVWNVEIRDGASGSVLRKELELGKK